MSCNCNNKNNGSGDLVAPRIKHVQGNVLRLAIPLTLRTIELVDGQLEHTDTDFIPSSDYPVVVVFSKDGKKIGIDAIMQNGNVAYIEDKGKIPVGTYDITVTCNDDNGNPYRFKQKTILQVVDATADADIVLPIEYEIQTWYLDAALYLALKGEDGVGIQDIVTQSSGEIGGTNTITIILTDGRTRSFTILNGSGTVDDELNINSGQPIANHAVTTKFNALDSQIADLFGDVDYNSTNKTIRFWDKGKTRVLSSIDARPFIKDGMVSNVYISNNTLVITFNTDAGREAIGVPLSSVFNPNNYYNKTQVDNKINQINALFNNYYNKTQVDNMISGLDGQQTLIIMDFEENPPIFHDANGTIMSHSNVIALLNDTTKSIVLRCEFEYDDVTYPCNLTLSSIDDNSQYTMYYFEGSRIASLGLSFEASLFDVEGTLYVDSWNAVEGGGSGFSGDYNDLTNKPTIPTKTSDLTNDSGFITASQVPEGADLSTVFADVAYNSQTHRINFYGKGDNNHQTVLAYIDASPFIVDGMVDNVTLSNGTLTITFNTDSGKQPISLSLGDIFNANNYYTKTETNTLISAFLTESDISVSSPTTPDGTVAINVGETSYTINLNHTHPQYVESGDLADVATSGSYNDLTDKPVIPEGADLSGYYDKTEVDGLLDDKVDVESGKGLSTNDYTTAEKNKLAGLSNYDDTTLAGRVTAIENAGYITTETDPTVPAWAKQSTKPTYTAQEVGALPANTSIPTKTSDLTNDSGFVVSSTLATVATSGSYNDLTNKPTIPSKTSDLTNDSGFINNALYYGTCETAAATMPKVCTVETFQTITDNGVTHAKDGTIIAVKFTNSDTNTTDAPELNVNSIGAKAIMYNNAIVTSTAKNTTVAGTAKMIAYYRYNASLDEGNGAWEYLGKSVDSNSTYSNASLGQGYGTQTNESTASAITASISSYALTSGGIVSIKFTYDVPANATLNINSNGAKAIYNQGAAITSGVIKAGDTATFIYSTYYHLISIDREVDIDDAKPLKVTISPDGNGGYTADKTYAEILAAWQSGRNVIAIKNEFCYQLSFIDDGVYFSTVQADEQFFEALAIQTDGTVDVFSPTEFSSFVPSTRTVNNKALSSNITLTASDVGAMATTHPANAITSAKISEWDAKANKVLLNLSIANSVPTITDKDSNTITKSQFMSLLDSAASGDILLSVNYSGQIYYFGSYEEDIEAYFARNELSYDGSQSQVYFNFEDNDFTAEWQSTLATQEYLSQLIADSTHRTVTDAEKATWNAKADKVTVVEVSTTGAVSQALDANKFYKFTGALTSLSLTLNAVSGSLAVYAGKFTTGSGWGSNGLSIPATVTEAANNDEIAASKTYEFSIVDNVIVIKEV